MENEIGGAVATDNYGFADERMRWCDSKCVAWSRCGYRVVRRGRPSRKGVRCARELAVYGRAVEGLAGDCDGYGVVEAASDVGFVDVLIDRCMRVFVEEEQFFRDEKGKGKGKGEEEQEAVKIHMQPAVDQLMRLFERKHKLVDACMSRKPPEDNRSEEQVSLARVMKEVVELGRLIIDEEEEHGCAEDAEGMAEEGSQPGDLRGVDGEG